MNPLTEAEASAVWDVLVEHAGAPEAERGAFVRYAAQGEISGWQLESLGFTGGFNLLPSRWYVDCGPEDETPERLAVIEKTNAALAALRREMSDGARNR